MPLWSVSDVRPCLVAVLERLKAAQSVGLPFANGISGIAVAESAAGALLKSNEIVDRARARIQDALEGLAVADLSPHFHDGYSGIVWAATALAPTLSFDLDADSVADVEAQTASFVRNSEEPFLDFIGGIAGLGTWLLKGIGVEAQAGVAATVAEFRRRCRKDESGAFWLTPVEAMPDRYRAVAGNDCVNLGTAHGLAGSIAYLAEAGRFHKDAEDLALDLARWLLSKRVLSTSSGSQFDAYVGSRGRVGTNRLGWCYGDLGVAVSLLRAARLLGDTRLEEQALVIGKRAAERRPDAATHGVGLCHGTSGVGHLFNRLFQASGDASFADSARWWLARSIDGWVDARATETTTAATQEYFGAFNGLAGLVLALSSAVSDEAPVWDRILLADIMDVSPRQPGVVT